MEMKKKFKQNLKNIYMNSKKIWGKLLGLCRETKINVSLRKFERQL